jgi:uncharacterized phage-associated protein
MITTTNAGAPDRISDALLHGSRERGDLITNLKLQKLLYYAQAWYLALNNEGIFQEDFQAWVHGPVLPSQYHRFKHNDWRPIMDNVSASRTGNPRLDKHLVKILDVFGVETAPALELMTHQERPWIDARRGLAATAPSKAIISKESMKKFYRQLGKDKEK